MFCDVACYLDPAAKTVALILIIITITAIPKFRYVEFMTGIVKHECLLQCTGLYIQDKIKNKNNKRTNTKSNQNKKKKKFEKEDEEKSKTMVVAETVTIVAINDIDNIF